LPVLRLLVPLLAPARELGQVLALDSEFFFLVLDRDFVPLFLPAWLVGICEYLHILVVAARQWEPVLWLPNEALALLGL
jgi:hypothetical protein